MIRGIRFSRRAGHLSGEPAAARTARLRHGRRPLADGAQPERVQLVELQQRVERGSGEERRRPGGTAQRRGQGEPAAARATRATALSKGQLASR